MELRLWLDGDDPVSGRLGTDAEHVTAFVGWLGLLGVLEALLSSEPARAAGGDPSGQLAAGVHPQLGGHV